MMTIDEDSDEVFEEADANKEAVNCQTTSNFKKVSCQKCLDKYHIIIILGIYFGASDLDYSLSHCSKSNFITYLKLQAN